MTSCVKRHVKEKSYKLKVRTYTTQGGPKNKPLTSDQKIVLTRIKTCE